MLHGIDPEPRPVEVAHEELGLVRPHPADEDPLPFRPVAIQRQPEEVGHFPQLVAGADRAELAEERPRLEVARPVEVDLPLDRERDRHDPSPRGSCQNTSGSRNAVLPMSSTGLPAKYRNDRRRGSRTGTASAARGAMIGRVDRDQGGLAVTPHPAGVGLVDNDAARVIRERAVAPLHGVGLLLPVDQVGRFRVPPPEEVVFAAMMDQAVGVADPPGFRREVELRAIRRNTGPDRPRRRGGAEHRRQGDPACVSHGRNSQASSDRNRASPPFAKRLTPRLSGFGKI